MKETEVSANMDTLQKRRSPTSRNVIMTAFIIVFFMTVILAYYSMLYSETRERIIKSGELSALSSAQQIDKYLSGGMDTIRLASYALDNMIRDGRSQKEIFDYILSQSIAIESVTSGNSIGLYGYINDEYLDGTRTGWIPDEDYDPTVRPWYTGPRASIGRVAVVDPYLDMDSMTIMIAFGKTLCDAKSVISIDYSMAPLQSIAEELSATDEADLEIVLDRKYQVIAHSDAAEIGKSYAAETDTFGRALVEGIRSSEEDFFSLRFDGEEYIVYVVPVANNWYCLSVNNATSEFGQLEKTLIFTIVASLLVVSVLLAIMLHANRKTQIAQQLQENLSQAESDIKEKEGQIGEISKVAFRDALTGVGSKAAFNQLAEELSADITEGKAALSVVMMDVNNLKYVNDTCGHDAGDAYLQGCCKIICETYRHSPVFRVGGDEFVAVLRNSDYEEREALAAKLNATFAETYAQEDKPAQERYSVAAGMADCEAGDTSLDQVFKRADKAMYAAKQEFKAKHGSYR